MSPEQRAVLAKAKKDGLKPSEQASEFLLHDLVEACLNQLKNYSVAWKNLSEKEQDASIGNLTAALKESAVDAVRLIMAAGASAIPFKLKSLTIDGKLKVTGLVEGDHPERHALTDKAHDKSEILLILSPRDYFEGLDTIKGEKDQKSLPLDDNKSAKKPAAKKADAKPIMLTEKQIEDGRQFILEVKKPTVAGMQAQLKFGYDKAIVALELYADEGLITRLGDDKYEMAKVAPDAPQGNPDLYGELTYSEVQQTVVMHKDSFEFSWVGKRFSIDEEQAKHLVLRLLDDEVIEAFEDPADDFSVTYNVIAKLEDLVI